MPIKHEEIIEDLEDHIRKSGGEHREWCVGTAKDARAPFFRRHLAADLGDGLIYREAFTTDAADQVIDHLVNHRGLRRANGSERGSGVGTTGAEAERRSALQDLPEPGKIVFVYRRASLSPSLASSGAAARPAPLAGYPAFPRRAA